MKRRSIKLLRKARNTEILNLETNHSSAYLQAPKVDEENPRTKKFAGSLLSEIPVPFASVFGIRTKDQEWRSLKTTRAIPTFQDMTNETRTRILHVVYSFGAAPSSILCRLVGLTARQVGQIRRWNIPNWRVLTNQHIARANNFNRIRLPKS
jgi:hypothetical protein